MPPSDGSGDAASTTQAGNIIPPNISITNLQGNVNITNIQGIIPGIQNVQVITLKDVDVIQGLLKLV